VTSSVRGRRSTRSFTASTCSMTPSTSVRSVSSTFSVTACVIQSGSNRAIFQTT
jgi:hypothetical protein